MHSCPGYWQAFMEFTGLFCVALKESSMKTMAHISSYAMCKKAGAFVALIAFGLALHAGLVMLAAFSVHVAAVLALTATLLFALLTAVVAGMAAPSVSVEPVARAVPAARPWR
jgi:hypothetical protein